MFANFKKDCLIYDLISPFNYQNIYDKPEEFVSDEVY